MKSSIINDINELLLKQDEDAKKSLYIEKLPLEPFIPSYSAYKTKALSLQFAIQKHREALIDQDTISYDACLNIISNMCGFESWYLFESTFEEYLRKGCNVDESIPLHPAYKAKALSLKSALQKYRETLSNQNKISYNMCLNIIAKMYGFENIHILKSHFNGNTNNAYNENLIEYVRYKFHAFIYEYNENNQFFNEEYLGDKDYFISTLIKLSKKLTTLHKLLADDKKIDFKFVAFIVKLAKYCCYFYYSIHQSKLAQFLDDLWDDRDLDEISKYQPISFALDELDKLENISKRVRVPHQFICLLQSARVLERNNQLGKDNQFFQHICKVINIFSYCLSTMQTKNFQSFNKDTADLSQCLRP